MTRVTRSHHISDLRHGYAKRGAGQATLEDRAQRQVIEAVRRGKKWLEYGDTLLVKCGDEFVDWATADPTKIGR